MTENLTTSAFVRLAQIIEEKFEVPREEITPDSELSALDVDSLALIELTLLLQKEFGVEIPTGEVTPDNTVGELAARLTRAQGDA